jgi:hypothetical protein
MFKWRGPMNIKRDNPFEYPNHALTQYYKYWYAYHNVVAYRLTLLLSWCAHMNMLQITLSHYSHHLFEMFNEMSIPRLYKIKC